MSSYSNIDNDYNIVRYRHITFYLDAKVTSYSSRSNFSFVNRLLGPKLFQLGTVNHDIYTYVALILLFNTYGLCVTVIKICIT